MKIRTEKPEDVAAIRSLNIAAFERDDEANLVDQLRGVDSTLSFVAIQDQDIAPTAQQEQIVGHIFYSPVAIASKYNNLNNELDNEKVILGLAPIAVLPEYQRQGIGSLLIRHSLQECVKLGLQAVVVLGHPAYYPKFGFIPARSKGLGCEYPVPDEVFMVLELVDGALNNCSGTVKYRPEFNQVS